MTAITELRCEYRNNPIGIGVRKPRISWRLLAGPGERAVFQTAYRIVVAEDDKFASVLWDSRKVRSDQSIHVELLQVPAVSCKRYYYRVQAWDQNDVCSPWSESAFWEYGLLDNREWIAEWIAPSDACSPRESERCPLLRKPFKIKSGIQSARIYATALGLYELELNGSRVGDSYFTPGWTSYKHRLQVQTYDVTDQLQPGDNVIGAVLGKGWYRGNIGLASQSNVYGNRCTLLLQLHLFYDNGLEEIILSDDSWLSAGSPILMSEIYHGEAFDARLALPGWSSPGFNAGDWFPVETISHPKHILVAQENEQVRRVEELKPIARITTPKGETVLDMGQNMVGWIRFSVEGDPGKEVKLLHAEVLDHEGNFYTDNLRSAGQAITYILRGGEKETYEPHFTFQGFRYVQLIGFDNPSLDDFTGVVLHSDLEMTGSFRCSDPLVNQLQHNIKWGLKGNFLDVPTDCPQRDERLGWTGDAQMFIRTASYLANVAPFFTKWLRDLKADQTEDGGVPFVIPQVLDEKAQSSAAWGDAAVICPWILYLCYGDTRILEEQYDSMAAWVEYVRSQGENEYLWNTGFHFGDWLGLDAKPNTYSGATDTSLIATAFYAYSVSLLQKTAAVIGKEQDAVTYAELHTRVVEAFTKEFVTPAGRLAVPTQTAHTLALMFELVKGPAKERIVRKLTILLEESDVHLTTGFVGTPYLNHVLSGSGHHAMAMKLLFQKDYPSWLYQITKGATTIWEHWDGIKEDGSFWSEDMNSFNHYAYGAIGDWLYRCIAGIDTDERKPGYKHITIRPQPGEGLVWAEGQLTTMYGSVRSFWRKSEDGRWEMEVTIPPNATAEIVLPDARTESVTESGLPLLHAAGIFNITESDTSVTILAGSGNYCFDYPIAFQNVTCDRD